MPATESDANAERNADAEAPARTTLVMLSGGVDSVYTLVKLLRETNDEVLAHHVHLVNIEQRHKVEAERCRSIIDICKREIRDVSYSESAIDHRGMRFFGYDMVTIGFEAGIVAHSYWLARDRMVDRWTVGTCAEDGSNPDRWRHVLACCAANCFPHEPPAFLDMPYVSKAEEMAYLPLDVLDLTWACRRPIRDGDAFRECGQCETCKLMEQVRARRADETAA